MTLTEIKIKIQKLYNTNPEIHINIHCNHPKMYYDNEPAIIRGVYPHIFQLEIKEELAATIEVGELIDTIEYDYPTFHLSMDCFWAKLVEGELILKEAEAARWLTHDELLSVNWLPADRDLIQFI